jgi:hypothetical protein
MTAKAGRPPPLVTTPRASPARGECVPHRAARRERGLGRAANVATPQARGLWLPSATRAPDVVEGLLVLWRRGVHRDRRQRAVVLQEEPSQVESSIHDETNGPHGSYYANLRDDPSAGLVMPLLPLQASGAGGIGLAWRAFAAARAASRRRASTASASGELKTTCST